MPIDCLHAERPAADSGRSAWTLLLSVSIFSSCFAASISSLSFFSFVFTFSSSLLQFALSFQPTSSPNAPATTSRLRLGRQSPVARLRSPWGGVLLVRRNCQSHADGLLFVSPPRTQPPLPSTRRDSSCGGSHATLSHYFATTLDKMGTKLVEPCGGCGGCGSDDSENGVSIQARYYLQLIQRQHKVLQEAESVRDLTCSDRSLVSDKLVNQPLYEEKGK